MHLLLNHILVTLTTLKWKLKFSLQVSDQQEYLRGYVDFFQAHCCHDVCHDQLPTYQNTNNTQQQILRGMFDSLQDLQKCGGRGQREGSRCRLPTVNRPMISAKLQVTVTNYHKCIIKLSAILTGVHNKHYNTGDTLAIKHLMSQE